MVCALQIKSQELFDEWVSKLRHHRLSRQNEIAAYTNEKSFHYPQYPSPNSPSLAESASIRKVIMSSAWRKTNALCVCVAHALIVIGGDFWVSLLLQCMSLRRQSTVPSAAAFPLSCNSQAKVAAWLQSSEDMDKCSKGETTLTRGQRGDNAAN